MEHAHCFPAFRPHWRGLGESKTESRLEECPRGAGRSRPALRISRVCPGQRVGADRQRGRRSHEGTRRGRGRHGDVARTCRASRWWSRTRPVSTASRSCHPGLTPCGSRRRATARSAARASTCASDRTLRLNVELLPETAGATEISVVGIAADRRRRLEHDRHHHQPGLRPEPRRLPPRRSRRREPVVRLSGRSPLPRPTPTSTAWRINGTTSPENSYLIDGLSVNNPAYGIIGTPADLGVHRRGQRHHRRLHAGVRPHHRRRDQRGHQVRR